METVHRIHIIKSAIDYLDNTQSNEWMYIKKGKNNLDNWLGQQITMVSVQRTYITNVTPLLQTFAIIYISGFSGVPRISPVLRMTVSGSTFRLAARRDPEGDD